MIGLRSTDTTFGSASASRESASRMSTRRGAVDRGLPADGTEQLLALQLVEHLGGVGRFERCQPEHDVAERFGEDAADAHHHTATELRVGVETGHELTRAEHHVPRRAGRRRRRPVAPRRGARAAAARDRVGVGEGQPHEATLGLVRDVRAVQLHHHRVRDLARRGDRRVGRARPARFGHRDPVSSDELGRVGLGERVGGGHGIGQPTGTQPPAPVTVAASRAVEMWCCS